MKKDSTKGYSVFNSVVYIIKGVLKYDKGLIGYFLAYTICSAVIPLTTLFLSPLLVDELTKSARIEFVLIILGSFLGLEIILYSIAQFCYRVYWPRVVIVRMNFYKELNLKIMRMPYRNIQNPRIQDMIQRGRQAIRNNQIGVEGLLNQIFNMCSGILTFVGIVTIVASLNVYVLLFLVVTVLVNYYFSIWKNKKDHSLNMEMAPFHRKITYINQQMMDFNFGKDVRLFNMTNWLEKKYKAAIDEKIKLLKLIAKNGFRVNNISAITTMLRDGLIYTYLILQVLNNGMSLAEFTLYFSAVMSFSGWMMNMLNSFANIQRQHLYINDFRKVLEIDDEENNDKKLENITEPVTIEFVNVSFRYPEGKRNILNNINLKIKAGEKLALVGENGAGKTTFVMLLSRLYEPTEGKILINGKNYLAYNREEYFKLISVVFQDVRQYAFTLRENVSLLYGESSDKEKVIRALNQAGLRERVENMKNGLNTNIKKIFDSEGVELSGGQAQRLALARALYKGSPIIILDEPTAALDPLAERDLYEKFNNFTQGKTALFISHRLASTRFCDNIAFLKNGEITEYGSHEELLENNKDYADLFRIQASYYDVNKLVVTEG